MYCQNCGTENKGGAKFCCECGSELLGNRTYELKPNKHNRSKINEKFKTPVIIGLVVAAFVALIAIVVVNVDSKNNVPESIIYEYFSDDLNNGGKIADISHNYNSDTHTDNLTVIIETEYEYGVRKSTNSLKYQYYASDDLWKLLDENETSKIHWDEKKLETTWQGKDDFSDWNIEIHDVDSETGTFTCSYEVNYYSRYYYNYNYFIGTLSGYNETHSNGQAFIDKEDSEGTSRFCFIDLSLTKGINVDTRD